MKTIETTIYELFTDNQWTLSTAESCTGGRIAACLTKQPGASEYFLGGIVCYSNELKKKLIHVPQAVLDHHGAVSKETVIAMAAGVIATTGSDFGIAISGIAGPAGGSPDKPVGTVWIAIVKKDHLPIAWCFHSHGTREMIMGESVEAALNGLLHYCTGLL